MDPSIGWFQHEQEGPSKRLWLSIWETIQEMEMEQQQQQQQQITHNSTPSQGYNNQPQVSAVITNNTNHFIEGMFCIWSLCALVYTTFEYFMQFHSLSLSFSPLCQTIIKNWKAWLTNPLSIRRLCWWKTIMVSRQTSINKQQQQQRQRHQRQQHQRHNSQRRRRQQHNHRIHPHPQPHHHSNST